MAGFKEETVEPAWIFAEDVEAAWLAGCNDARGARRATAAMAAAPFKACGRRSCLQFLNEGARVRERETAASAPPATTAR